MDAKFRDISFLRHSFRSSELCTFVLFFVSLDQLLCKKKEKEKKNFTTIKAGHWFVRYFSFYRTTFSQRSLSVIALLSVLLWKAYFVLISDNKTTFLLMQNFINIWSMLIFFFPRKKKKKKNGCSGKMFSPSPRLVYI